MLNFKVLTKTLSNLFQLYYLTPFNVYQMTHTTVLFKIVRANYTCQHFLIIYLDNDSKVREWVSYHHVHKIGRKQRQYNSWLYIMRSYKAASLHYARRCNRNGKSRCNSRMRTCQIVLHWNKGYISLIISLEVVDCW